GGGAPGMRMRLAGEHERSAAAKGAVESRLGSALGPARPTMEQTFEAGAAAALAILPQRLTPAATQGAQAPVDVAAWKKWADAVDALTAGAGGGAPDSAARLRLLLAGLETLLIQGPEPDANKGMGEAVGELTQ